MSVLSRRDFLTTAASLALSAPAFAAMGPNDKFDLVIKGGDVLDPSQSLRGKRDIGIRFGLVEAALNPRVIQVFDVVDGTKLANKRAFINAEPGGTPDGFRVDVDGNLWCGWGMGNPEQDGVKIFNPEGKPIGRISLPERCANVCFGGPKRNRLFMAASHSVYSLYVNTQGVKGG